MPRIISQLTILISIKVKIKNSFQKYLTSHKLTVQVIEYSGKWKKNIEEIKNKWKNLSKIVILFRKLFLHLKSIFI